MGWRSYQAYANLQTASTEVADLQDRLTDITDVDSTATAATIGRLQSAAATARSAVDDPVFRSATAVPFVGANLAALREVTLTVDSLATEVMPSLVDIAQTLRPAELAPAGGAINLEPIQRISPLLQTADDAVLRARRTLAGIDRSAVVQPVGDAVLALWRKLDQAAAATEPGARIARLLPPMLGSTGPRTYLVVFQNPAEPRATGGIFGSFAVISADQGKITIQRAGRGLQDPGPFRTRSRGAHPRSKGPVWTGVGAISAGRELLAGFPDRGPAVRRDVPATQRDHRQRSAGHRPGRPFLHDEGDPADSMSATASPSRPTIWCRRCCPRPMPSSTGSVTRASVTPSWRTRPAWRSPR